MRMCRCAMPRATDVATERCSLGSRGVPSRLRRILNRDPRCMYLQRQRGALYQGVLLHSSCLVLAEDRVLLLRHARTFKCSHKKPVL